MKFYPFIVFYFLLIFSFSISFLFSSPPSLSLCLSFSFNLSHLLSVPAKITCVHQSVTDPVTHSLRHALRVKFERNVRNEKMSRALSTRSMNHGHYILCTIVRCVVCCYGRRPSDIYPKINFDSLKIGIESF